VTAEEPRRNPYGGDAVTKEASAITLRKRRLQQWLALEGRPECSCQVQQLRAAIAQDPVSKWAEVGKQDVPRARVEGLVELARAEEDKALA
jgi:hypothetical protein